MRLAPKVNLNLTSRSLQRNSPKVALLLTQTNSRFMAPAGSQYPSIFKRRVYHETVLFRNQSESQTQIFVNETEGDFPCCTKYRAPVS